MADTFWTLAAAEAAVSVFSEVELKVRALDARVALAGVNDERPVHTDNDNPDDLLRREFSLAARRRHGDAIGRDCCHSLWPKHCSQTFTLTTASPA